VADDTYDVFVSYSRADGHVANIDSILRDKGLRTAARGDKTDPRKNASRQPSSCLWLILARTKSLRFISYSRKDMPFADRFVAALSERGFEPLIDRREMRKTERLQRRAEHRV
jgi:TIR domain